MKIRSSVIFPLVAFFFVFPMVLDAWADQKNQTPPGNVSKLSPPSNPPTAAPSEFFRSWIFGIRGGFSFPNPEGDYFFRDIRGDLNSGVGTYVSADAMYGLARHILAGLDVDYYSLPFTQYASGMSIGSSETVTILPTIEFRSDKFDGKVSVYASLGAGVTFNSFANSSELNQLCAANALGCMTSVEPFSLGIRGGFGLDYFLTDTFAFNMELGIMGNFSSANLKLNPVATVPLYNGSGGLTVASLLFGFHYLVPR